MFLHFFTLLLGGLVFLCVMAGIAAIWKLLRDKRAGNRTCSTSTSVPRVRLEHVPTEIILHLATFLRPEEKAVLALTSKTMLRKLDPDGQVFRLPTPEARYNLLLHLSRDGACLPRILCQWCRLFHDPRPSPGWSAARQVGTLGGRACEQYTTRKDQVEGSVFLPWRLHYNLVMAVMFCRRQGFDTSQHMEYLNQLGKEELLVTEQGHKLMTRHRFRINGECLYLKTEKLIWLGKRQTDLAIVESISEVSRMMEGEGANTGSGTTTTNNTNSPASAAWKRNHICRHLNWVTQFPQVFALPINYPGQLGPGRRLDIWKLPSTDEQNLTKYNKCICCSTDYCMRFIRMPDTIGGVQGPPVEICVLTTWKTLGTGLTVNENRWNGHMFGDASVVPRRWRTFESDFDPCRRFEGISRGWLSKFSSLNRAWDFEYRSVIEREALLQLTD